LSSKRKERARARPDRSSMSRPLTSIFDVIHNFR
jgi:hypothetical protein